MVGWLLGCTAVPHAVRTAPATPADPTTEAPTPTDPGDLTPPTTPTETTCGEPLGSACNPIPADPLPFEDSGDTRKAPESRVDRYGCAADTDESGPEVWYAVTLTESGVLTASVNDTPGDDVDVDVHLLASTDPDDCLARDNQSVSESLEPGTYYLAIDSWVGDDGTVYAGRYRLNVSLSTVAGGNCATVATDVRMFWSSCAGSVPDCFETGGSVYLSTPTVGPVVQEAHLVTVDDGFGGGWPGSYTDGLSGHYANSEAATGYVMNRDQPWAPAGEGGSEYGQSAFGAKLPVVDEAWYLNMYWRDRPDPGTRLIVTNPDNGRAVVAAGGYETGPGDNTAIAGVTEEVHDWLGTGHLDDLEIGFAADQTLPLGPIVCE